jgi:hypothetical protein
MRGMARILLCALALAGSSAAAQAGPGIAELGRARSYGMGGAFRALGAGTEAVEGSPASIAVRKRYLIELGGAWDPRNPFGFGSVSVMDSVTSPLAAGLSYSLVALGEGDAERVAHVNTGAFALPIVSAFHVGMSIRHVLMTGSRSANAFTGDAGAVLLLGPLSISATGHNLINIYNPDFPRTFSAGLGFTTPVFALAVDGRGDFRGEEPAYAVHAGGEFIIARVVPVRAGYAHDDLRGSRTVTGGAGFFIQNGAVDLAYQHELGGSYSRLLAISFRMLVQ